MEFFFKNKNGYNDSSFKKLNNYDNNYLRN